MKKDSKIKFKILDLFSGAGGLSYGLEMLPNFKTLIATDNNMAALETFKRNMPHSEIIYGDITDPLIKQQIIDKSKKNKINMIVGGPPCQGFSLKGKNLGLSDERNFLFLEFLDIVNSIKPDIFIIENVKNIVNSSNGYFLDKIKNLSKKLGYCIDWNILDASNFGVPQHRERAIIIGSRLLNGKLQISSIKKTYNKPVTVREAISDLSYLNSGEGEIQSDYITKPQSQYQKKMRINSEKLFNHKATNHSSQAIYKLSLIPPEKGKNFLPKNLLGEQKFNTTWCRLEWDRYSPTIDTRFDTPSNGKNSHPFLDRAITPREAARLQSFPDKFVFVGKKTDICKQIGNAVPPLMAKSIGEFINNQLRMETIQNENYLLYHDDALRISPSFREENVPWKIDHIITDPPYNISQSNNFTTLKNRRRGLDFGEWDKNFDLYNWIDKYSQVIDKNGSFIIFCSYKYMSYIIDKLEKNDFVTKDIIHWKKSNPMPRNVERRYVQDTEYAVWAVKRDARWVFNKGSDFYLRSQIETSVVSGNEKTSHPTQKSLNLMKEIIRIHTNEGDTILDPFMGSGTTGIAALDLKRKFIGVEINNDYFNETKERFTKKL